MNENFLRYINAKKNGLYYKGLPYRKKYIKSLRENFLKITSYKTKTFLRNIFVFRHTYSNSFRKFIEGKKICIVGPLQGEAGDGAKIDSFDIVVRCNQRNNIIKQKTHKGRSLSLNYFNGQFGIEFLEKNQPHFFDKQVIFCFKLGNKSLYRLEGFHGRYRFFDSRITEEEKNERFLGSAQLIPLIVNDLIRHKAGLIYIFHADLLLSIPRAKEYYSLQYKYLNQKCAVLTNSGSHDAVSSFVYLKNLYKKKRIYGDSKFTKAIRLSVKQYCQKMESKYKFAH